MRSAGSRGEDECQKQNCQNNTEMAQRPLKSRPKPIWQPREISATTTCTTTTTATATTTTMTMTTKKNECLKKMQHNYVFRLHYLTYRVPVSEAITPMHFYSTLFHSSLLCSLSTTASFFPIFFRALHSSVHLFLTTNTNDEMHSTRWMLFSLSFARSLFLSLRDDGLQMENDDEIKWYWLTHISYHFH